MASDSALGVMLRTRLFLNLVPFVVILLAVGIYAIVLFSRLAANVDVVVMRNYFSVIAAQNMELALAHMQGGILMGSEENAPLGLQVFNEAIRLFNAQLSVQLANVSTDREKTLSAELQTSFDKLRATGQELLRTPERAARQDLSHREFAPLLSRSTALLKDLRELNHLAILQTQETGTRSVRDVTRLMVLGILISLVFTGYACYHLSRSILIPIQDLTRATRELAQGALERPVAVQTRDELGQLAVSFNKMAAQLQAYRDSTAERIMRLHRTMETTLASFPDPIFVLNRDSRIELRNPAANALAKALHLGEQLPPVLQDIARKVLDSGQEYLPKDFQAVLQFSVDGEHRFYLPRVVTMREQECAQIGVAVVLYDVTRFRLLDDAKSNLVATVSHELKTPLTGLRMALHLLADSKFGPLNPRQTDLTNTARDDAERLLRILNSLLDLTRLEDGRTELQLETIAPETLVTTAAAEMQEVAAPQGVQLVTAVDAGLPSVRVDPVRLSHVFSNLITNAIKYSPPHSTVNIRARKSGDEGIVFSVVDQGPGIPRKYLNRVFERFFRLPSQSNTGVGLGLSIAREILLAHGGRIGVISEPGQGSEFFFVLPALK